VPRLDKSAVPDGRCKVLVHGRWCDLPVPDDFAGATICAAHREERRFYRERARGRLPLVAVPVEPPLSPSA
jgi:hypothetical protein